VTTTLESPDLIEPEEPGGPDAHGHEAPSHEGGHEHHGPHGILNWLTSTDHKVIGKSYMITSLVTFFISGVMALVIRAQLASPTSSLVNFQTYNELFTMHGSLMLYLFAGPFAFGGLANYIVPLQVGAPDMAYPRLNPLSYWLSCWYLGQFKRLEVADPSSILPYMAPADDTSGSDVAVHAVGGRHVGTE